MFPNTFYFSGTLLPSCVKRRYNSNVVKCSLSSSQRCVIEPFTAFRVMMNNCEMFPLHMQCVMKPLTAYSRWWWPLWSVPPCQRCVMELTTPLGMMMNNWERISTLVKGVWWSHVLPSRWWWNCGIFPKLQSEVCVGTTHYLQGVDETVEYSYAPVRILW